MARIKLSTLAVCDQDLNTPSANLAYYQNIYAESETGIGIDRNSAMEAYWGRNKVNQDDLKMVLQRMEDKEIHNLTSPITRSGSLLFHSSRGDSDSDDSASVFFRIYALTAAEKNNLVGGGYASAAEIIYISYNSGIVRVKVRKPDGSVSDGIVADLDKFKITIGGTDYFLVLDVVGIGYHLPARNQDKYRMFFYNNHVLTQQDIDLSQSVL